MDKDKAPKFTHISVHGQTDNITLMETVHFLNQNGITVDVNAAQDCNGNEREAFQPQLTSSDNPKVHFLNQNGITVDVNAAQDCNGNEREAFQPQLTSSDNPKDVIGDNPVISNRALAQHLRRERERSLGLIRSLPICATLTPATISQRRRRGKGKIAPTSALPRTSAPSNDVRPVTPTQVMYRQPDQTLLTNQQGVLCKRQRKSVEFASFTHTQHESKQTKSCQPCSQFESLQGDLVEGVTSTFVPLHDTPTLSVSHVLMPEDDIEVEDQQIDPCILNFVEGDDEVGTLLESTRVEEGLHGGCLPLQLSSGEQDNIPNGPDQYSHEVDIDEEYDMGPQIVLPSDSNRSYAHGSRHSLGNMDVRCPHCSALHWMDERLCVSSKINPRFGTCCLQGKIKLPLLTEPPTVLLDLYNGEDQRSISFQTHIREYNAANAFTSLGFKVDKRVVSAKGPKPVTIHGELRHQTGSLLPQPEQDPSYAQLYIYDPDVALDICTRRNKHLRRDLLEIIQGCLLQHNVFARKYIQAFELLCESNDQSTNIPAYLHYSATKDRRRYNLPSADEIAVILPGDGTEVTGSRDIVIHLRGNQELMRISECHPAYLPLHYVLLFPRGELGWEPEMRQWDAQNNSFTTDRLNQMNYYCYRLFQHPTEYSTILRAGKLFQEFLVDAWAATEQNRLNYIRLNQDSLRVEFYQGLTDVVANDIGPNQVGKRFILPSSFTGSARYMFEIFQDSMAITRYNKHPDIFLTMTANPNWPEIWSALLPHQTPIDRPYLVARVFELKRRQLMKVIKEKNIFGKKCAHVFTIEFQKRGLPHMHLLIFLEHADKIRTPAQVDNYVSAEFPHPNEEPELFETVLRCMVHGPCGTRNSNAPCMENGRCTKGYPRKFAETTTMDKDGYPIYCRRYNGKVYMKGKYPVDNRDIVPYNPYLTKMFDCHINVEVCAGLRCVKYIHKYIYKGHDRTTMILGSEDEIQQYLDARYIGPPEAAWRLFGHLLHQEDPTVVRLALHLPGMHNVVFNSRDNMDEIISRAEHQRTTLTAFFECCASHEIARSLTYQEVPQYFVWNKSQKKWIPRKTHKKSIGRMYFASPNSGELFYLRLLLTVVKGPPSYEYLKTINNVLHDSFKSACIAKGLLEDDDEWIHCLEEAAIMKTGYQLRRLFCIILTQCSPTNPYSLWIQFSTSICDDLAHKIRTMFGISNPTMIEIEDYGLYLLNEMLQESGKSLKDFPPFPQPSRNWCNVFGNRLLWEHRQLQYDAQQEDPKINVDRLNSEQQSAYEAIIALVTANKGSTFFLSGGAGTGKTFLYNIIATQCRSLGHIVVTVASSGIVSLLLVGGRTAHSMFSIPLDIQDNSVCGFSIQSLQAGLFRETKLIIWDEVPMQNRHCVEAVDRTLQDICDNKKLFGGITVVLGGDFRQILPVIPKGVREQIVGASLRRSPLWKNVHVLILSQNMRLHDSEDGTLNFANFLLEVVKNPQETVELPSTVRKCKDLDELISSVYPSIDVPETASSDFLRKRTILSARNDDVSVINNTVLNKFPGETISFLAADKMSKDDESDRSITNQYPTEYLNSLDPSGLPPFKLNLKVGCPIMLLRNLAPKDGQCNGTRMMVVRCTEHIIEAQILHGDKAGNLFFIPRISLTPSSSELPFQMTRRQFPVRLAFAMTMNKSQGQSVKFVGIDLRTPVFSHGQLYVALSRCTSSRRISVLLPDGSNSTTNIVYPEVLL